jgi:hypothetical protein
MHALPIARSFFLASVVERLGLYANGFHSVETDYAMVVMLRFVV